jgi:hypothetical protein
LKSKNLDNSAAIKSRASADDHIYADFTCLGSRGNNSGTGYRRKQGMGYRAPRDTHVCTPR